MINSLLNIRKGVFNNEKEHFNENHWRYSKVLCKE